MEVLSLFFSLTCLSIVNLVGGDCSLSFTHDFTQTTPLLLQDGGLFAPNSRGAMLLRRSDTLTAACPGSRRRVMLNNQDSGYDTVEAHCILNDTFRVNRWIGPFKNITCNTQPSFSAEETGARCYGGHKMYRVGYEVKSKFLSVYEACFDADLYSTLYVTHKLTPASAHAQTTGRRPQFSEGKLFGKVRMSQLYGAKNQAERLNAALGEHMADEYLTKKQFITRGHLAPRADFPTYAVQRASFHYVNTAPQWMRGNAGDWAALEDALRRRVSALGRPLTVYTGAHGVLTLQARDGALRQLYLHVDANNNQVVPVPLYFYKLVYDPKTKKATAFVSINSSYYSGEVARNLTFCEDVCDGSPHFKWLRWRSNDGTTSFCCEYEQFLREVQELPVLDVSGLFY